MASIKGIISQSRPNLKSYEDLYIHFHIHPELSNHEASTAARITSHLQSLSPDLAITTSIGGHGQIAILRNGPGPTVLLRADIDALPVLEKSGKPYASTKRMVDSSDGVEKPVMHACGHDFHVTALLAAAECLLKCRGEWAGTLVFLFQPAEEKGTGAKAMVDDGLYDTTKHACPIPDVVLGQHVFPLRAGKVATRAGVVMSAADSFKITVYGRGAHGSMPHVSVDPVVVACSVVVKLQTIVSREVPPDEMAVVTVGSVRAGEAENVIPDEAVVTVDIRTKNEGVRRLVRESMERIVRGECIAGGCTREPTFERLRAFPITSNDAETVKKLDGPMKEYFGEDWDSNFQYVLGSEDFNILGSSIDRPYTFWFFGGYEKERYEQWEREGKFNEMPVNHSPFFAPVMQPTLMTGVDALCVAALTYLKK